VTDAEARLRIGVMAGRKVEETPGSEGSDLDELIARLVDAHPETVKDYRNNPRAANFLIGQVMKETQGKYQSKDVSERIKKELEERV